jgi:hypothetical protein
VYVTLGTPQSKREEFKADSPAPSHIDGCRTTFPFDVEESPKIGEVGGEVSEPKRTSIPPTCTRSYPGMSSLTTTEGDKRGLDVISTDVMGCESAVDDKRSALDAPDTDDDDGCAEQSDGAGAGGPKPEQSGTRNKKLRHGEGAPRGVSEGKIRNDKRRQIMGREWAGRGEEDTL